MMCQCFNPNHIVCLMHQLGDKERTFAECMGGCHCPCHFTTYGALIAREEWMDNRYTVARASQERHTDPRIEALMPQEVKER